MPELTSRPYRPNPAKCCERCVFGNPWHATWCPENKAHIAMDTGHEEPTIQWIEEISEVTPELYGKVMSRTSPFPPLNVFQTNPTRDSWIKKRFVGKP